MIFNVEVEVEGRGRRRRAAAAQRRRRLDAAARHLLGRAAPTQPSALAPAAASGRRAVRRPRPTPRTPAPVVEQRRVDEHEQIGRNDPCWCGSGKKYKKCHGAAIAAAPR